MNTVTHALRDTLITFFDVAFSTSRFRCRYRDDSTSGRWLRFELVFCDVMMNSRDANDANDANDAIDSTPDGSGDVDVDVDADVEFEVEVEVEVEMTQHIFFR